MEFQNSIITSTLGHYVEPDCKKTFRVKVFYPVSMIREIEIRFSDTSCNIMKCIQALNPSSSSFLRKEEIVILVNAYESNVEDIKHELH